VLIPEQPKQKQRQPKYNKDNSQAPSSTTSQRQDPNRGIDLIDHNERSATQRLKGEQESNMTQIGIYQPSHYTSENDTTNNQRNHTTDQQTNQLNENKL
jgi:hypothetical protein